MSDQLVRHSVCAGGCGRMKPAEKASDKGWRRGYCRNCYHKVQGYPPSTEAVRRYRSDPEKRERDREVSRRWKREKLGQPGLPKESRDG